MTRFTKAVAAALALAFLVIAPPTFLILGIGNPWPDEGVSLTGQLGDNAVFGILAVALWIVWAQMMLSFIVEAYAAIADQSVDVRLPVLSVQQDLARLLIGAIITTTVAATPLGVGLAAHEASAQSATTAQVATSSQTQTDSRGSVSEQHGAATSASNDDHAAPRAATQKGAQAAPNAALETAAPTASITVTVQRGDTLWSLADQYLDDGERWTEIAEANQGQVMVDGATFTSVNSIRPGWRLTVPNAQPEQAAPSEQAAATSHEVETGDTLWDIAEDELGDGTRYPELFDASRDLMQPGRQRLTDPDHIEPGWEVRFPAAESARGSNDPADTPASPETDSDSTAAPRGDSRADARADSRGDGRGNGRGEREPRDGEAAQPPAANYAADAERADASDDTADGDSAEGDAGDGSVLDAAWVLPGLTGGGVLLAGALYLGLQRRRRAQFRARRPGRAIAAPPVEAAATEMTLNAVGSPASATVAFMDEALRRLAEQARVQQTAMPALAAVQLHKDLLTLHLSNPTNLPEPWSGSPDRMHWSCSTTTPLEDLGPDHGWADAPYPLLVTVGVDDSATTTSPSPTTSDAAVGPDAHGARGGRGDLWLLNCEELGTLEVRGDTALARDFARHLAAQLAVNPWSQQVSIDCVGIAEETAPLGDRVRYHDAGGDSGGAVDEVLARAVTMVDRTAHQNVDASTARTHVPDDDVWPAHMLLIAAEATAAVDDNTAATGAQSLAELRRLVTDHAGRTGTAIVIAGDDIAVPDSDADPETSSTEIHVNRHGRVLLEQQGLDLAAVGMTGEEAQGCALLYTHAEILDDVAVPVDDTATQGWASLVDQTGALRRELTLPRLTPEEDLDEPATSLLPEADEDYVTAAPAVAEDLEALAPRVPHSVLAQVKVEDPTLDTDLADWLDADCPRPKLTLLGPAAVRTHGRPLAKYKALCTEIVAYLALRPRNGATRDELAEALGWDDPARVRKYVDLVRHWLGQDPQDGGHYLPHANKSVAALTRGVNVYQVTDGLLSDWDLFRRLRARGTHEDLVAALELVTGRPFDQLRPGGWNWLRQGHSHDQHAAHAVADVAFTVVTQSLCEGDLARARAATEAAILAVPDDQIVQLCQVALTEAEGNNAEAMRVLLEDVCNASEDGEGPLDLPERTRQIIRNHQWMAS